LYQLIILLAPKATRFFNSCITVTKCQQSYLFFLLTHGEKNGRVVLI